MTSLVLNLQKPGEQPPKIALNLKKGERFMAKLSWDGHTDIDLHALVALNAGSGARVSAVEDILSTYNVKRRIGGEDFGTLTKRADGCFEIRAGALIHSPDAIDGSAEGVDEWIKVDPSLIQKPSTGVVEIPLIAMIHPQHGSKRFRDVANAVVTIENAEGMELMRAGLSNQFGENIGVQMGSVMIHGDGKAEFVGVGVGFNGDFNEVLGHFC